MVICWRMTTEIKACDECPLPVGRNVNNQFSSQRSKYMCGSICAFSFDGYSYGKCSVPVCGGQCEVIEIFNVITILT